MKAAFLEGPRQLVVREVPEPGLPEDGILLRVEACGVCGSDVRRWREGPATLNPPTVPGHEVAGTVVAVGSACNRAQVGDRFSLAPDVHCDECYYCQHGLYNLCDHLDMIGITPGFYGGFAELMAIPGRVFTDGVIHRLPAGLAVRAGALGEPMSSVLATHQRYGTGLEHTVVVIGAGPIGCMHVAVAKAQGARVIVSQKSEPRRSLVQRFAPDLVVNPQEDDLVEAVREYTGGVGADMAICANPVAATQGQAVELVRKGGTVVLFGGLPKSDPMTHLDGNRIHYGEISVVGIFSYRPIHHALALDVLARGVVSADDLITHTFALEDAQLAMETADAGQGLKAMLVPG